MKLKIGIDVGGTFTDFLVTGQDQEPQGRRGARQDLDEALAALLDETQAFARL